MVAIKGALIPRCCQNCFLIRYHDTLGYSCKATKNHITKNDVSLKRANDCPLVEIKERKVGKWIYDKASQNWRCSVCNETPKTLGYVGTSDFMEKEFAFCNHCGSEMVGAENG